MQSPYSPSFSNFKKRRIANSLKKPKMPACGTPGSKLKLTAYLLAASCISVSVSVRLSGGPLFPVANLHAHSHKKPVARRAPKPGNRRRRSGSPRGRKPPNDLRDRGRQLHPEYRIGSRFGAGAGGIRRELFSSPRKLRRLRTPSPPKCSPRTRPKRAIRFASAKSDRNGSAFPSAPRRITCPRPMA